MRIPSPVAACVAALVLVLAFAAAQQSGVVHSVGSDCGCGINPSRLRTFITTIPPQSGVATTPLLSPSIGNGVVVTSILLSSEASSLSPQLVLNGQRLLLLDTVYDPKYVTNINGGLRVDVGSTLALEVDAFGPGTITVTVLGYTW